MLYLVISQISTKKITLFFHSPNLCILYPTKQNKNSDNFSGFKQQRTPKETLRVTYWTQQLTVTSSRILPCLYTRGHPHCNLLYNSLCATEWKLNQTEKLPPSCLDSPPSKLILEFRSLFLLPFKIQIITHSNKPKRFSYSI